MGFREDFQRILQFLKSVLLLYLGSLSLLTSTREQVFECYLAAFHKYLKSALHGVLTNRGSPSISIVLSSKIIMMSSVLFIQECFCIMATLTNREPSELVAKRIFYALQVRTRTILNTTVDREIFTVKKFSSMTFSDGIYKLVKS